MSGQYPQGWQQPIAADPYGTQPTVPLVPTDPYGYHPTQPIQPTDPYGQQWTAARVVPVQQPAPAYTPGGYAPGYAPGVYASGYVAAPKTNTMALVGFILALVGVPVAPIIMGHIARKQIRATGEGGDGLALAAIIVGYIVAGLIAALLVYWIVMAVVFFGLFGAMVASGY